MQETLSLEVCCWPHSASCCLPPRSKSFLFVALNLQPDVRSSTLRPADVQWGAGHTFCSRIKENRRHAALLLSAQRNSGEMTDSDNLKGEMERFEKYMARETQRKHETRAAILAVLKSLQIAFERYPVAERFEASHCRDVSATIQGLLELLEQGDSTKSDGAAQG